MQPKDLMKVLGVIPSRYQSKRFPGKPLANILGKTMLQRVYEQCKKSSLLKDIIIATDDLRILNHVQNFGAQAMMTSKSHNSGTERCNEVVQKINSDYDLIVNIQGDEPYIQPEQINELITLFKKEKIELGTLARIIKKDEILKNINRPKVIIDDNHFAKKFCRIIKHSAAKKIYHEHIGLYAYTPNVLSEICSLKETKLEKKENLEQIRWLDNKFKIKIGITNFKSLSVDVPNDIVIIESQMR